MLSITNTKVERESLGFMTCPLRFRISNIFLENLLEILKNFLENFALPIKRNMK